MSPPSPSKQKETAEQKKPGLTNGPGTENRTLFACNHNLIRSPMATFLARQQAPKTHCFESAGLLRREANPFALSIMQEIGVDLREHRPRYLDEMDLTLFNCIIALTPEAREQVTEKCGHQNVEILSWPTPDPTFVFGSRNTILSAYGQLRSQLEEQIKSLFEIQTERE